MLNIIIDYQGIEWECFYEYDEPQKADDTDPAIPGIATIYRIRILLDRVSGYEHTEDLIDHIKVQTLYDIEREIEASHEDF